MTDLILFLLTGLGGGGWYVWTGYISRKKPCRTCKGWGFTQRRGLLRGGDVDFCRTCDGEGEKFRPAARHVQRRRARNTARAARAARHMRNTRNERKAVTWQ